jgi:hypothetical protein
MCRHFRVRDVRNLSVLCFPRPRGPCGHVWCEMGACGAVSGAQRDRWVQWLGPGWEITKAEVDIVPYIDFTFVLSSFLAYFSTNFASLVVSHSSQLKLNWEHAPPPFEFTQVARQTMVKTQAQCRTAFFAIKFSN